MTTTNATASTPLVKTSHSLGWFVSRAILGLVIMLGVTGIAALIAHASIDTSDIAVDELTIGTPAGPLVGRKPN